MPCRVKPCLLTRTLARLIHSTDSAGSRDKYYVSVSVFLVFPNGKLTDDSGTATSEEYEYEHSHQHSQGPRTILSGVCNISVVHIKEQYSAVQSSVAHHLIANLLLALIRALALPARSTRGGRVGIALKTGPTDAPLPSEPCWLLLVTASLKSLKPFIVVLFITRLRSRPSGAIFRD